MNANLAEVGAKARLEECTCRCIQRLAWRAQHFMHNGRGQLRKSGCMPLQRHLLLFAFLALSAAGVFSGSLPIAACGRDRS